MHPEVLTEDAKPLFPLLRHFPDFYLAGGTALALQIRHRVSVDFDLFTGAPLSPSLLQNVERVFPHPPIPLVNDPGELTVTVNGVKITFLHYPFPLLLGLITYEGVSLLHPQEIGATKAYTLGRRGSYKDYLDLYFLLSEKHLSLGELITLAEQKYGEEFNSRLFLEQLLYLDDVQETALPLFRGSVTKDSLQSFFSNEITHFSL